MTDLTKIPDSKLFMTKDLAHQNSQDFLRIYTNSANFGLNFFDLTITFGEMVSEADANGMHIENRVAVTMSLEHAKALADALQKALDVYEASHQAKIRKAPLAAPTVTEGAKLVEGGPAS